MEGEFRPTKFATMRRNRQRAKQKRTVHERLKQSELEMSALREKIDELMDQLDKLQEDKINLERRNKSLMLENEKQKEISGKLAIECQELLRELKECQE